MRINRTLAFFFLIFNYHLFAEPSLNEIPHGKAIISPNKRFLATFNGAIIIVDQKENTQFAQIGVLSPIYYFEWSGNSKSLIIVEHIAGGSDLCILHFNGDSWIKHEIDPPPKGDFDTFKVIGLKTRFESVDVNYIAGNRAINKTSTKQISFNLDLENLLVDKIKTKEISFDQYRLLNDRY